ncbi:MAG: hypothetical protein P4N59_03465 [Negativicutes bacterium]|nr:hypothetical protein [Negativicutes bacterium]
MRKARQGQQRKVVQSMSKKAKINAEWLSGEVGGMIYNQGKAKVMNVVETLIPLGTDKHRGYSRLVEDIMDTIGKNAVRLIKDTLGNWEQEVELGKELTGEELAAAKAEYAEVDNVLKK